MGELNGFFTQDHMGTPLKNQNLENLIFVCNRRPQNRPSRKMLTNTQDTSTKKTLKKEYRYRYTRDMFSPESKQNCTWIIIVNIL